MASIEKRVRNGRAYYRARYRDPSGRQRNKTFRRKVDAEKYLALIEAAKLRGTWTDSAHGKTTLAEWLETWWGSAADLRPSTVARDRAYLNSSCSRASAQPHWPQSPNRTCKPGWPS